MKSLLSIEVEHAFQRGDVIVFNDVPSGPAAGYTMRSFYGGLQRFVIADVFLDPHGAPTYKLTRLTAPVQNDHDTQFEDAVDFIDAHFHKVLS